MGDNSLTDWALLALIVLMACAPLVAVTVIAYRSGRKGWWLAGPWILLAGLWLLCLQMFHSAGRIGADEMAITILGAGLIGAWFSLTLYLIALTIVGPKAPRPGSVGRN